MNAPATVRILLGASLRHHPDADNGVVRLPLDGPATVREVLAKLGVEAARARIVLVNHRKAFLDTVVRPGDRMAVFPPELAFNMYVALELAHHGQSEGK